MSNNTRRFPDYNQLIAHGNISRDPETLTTKSGNKKVQTSLAMTKPLASGQASEGDDSQFIQLVIYNTPQNNQLADFFEAHIRKGSRIQVNGRLQQDSRKVRVIDAGGNEREQNVYYTFILVDQVTFLGSNKKSDAETAADEEFTPQQPQRQGRQFQNPAKQPFAGPNRPQAAVVHEAAPDDDDLDWLNAAPAQAPKPPQRPQGRRQPQGQNPW